MYDGKAYRNLESTKQEIKLSWKDKFYLVISPSIIIHTDVFCQAEIQGGKMVTTIDNETFLYKIKEWFRKKFPKKGGIVEAEPKTDVLAEPPKSSRCFNCHKEEDVNSMVLRNSIPYNDSAYFCNTCNTNMSDAKSKGKIVPVKGECTKCGGPTEHAVAPYCKSCECIIFDK